MPLQTGAKLGPYEILAPIGAGGMGEKLEKTFVPAVAARIEWGNLAGVRDQLLRAAGHRGSATVAQLRTELDELGPTGLSRETVRQHLQEHGFVQQANESFAETMARALGIGIRELKAHLMQGSIGKALLDRSAGPTIRDVVDGSNIEA